jgi:hypothetical protein
MSLFADYHTFEESEVVTFVPESMVDKYRRRRWRLRLLLALSLTWNVIQWVANDMPRLENSYRTMQR